MTTTLTTTLGLFSKSIMFFLLIDSFKLPTTLELHDEIGDPYEYFTMFDFMMFPNLMQNIS